MQVIKSARRDARQLVTRGVLGVQGGQRETELDKVVEHVHGEDTGCLLQAVVGTLTDQSYRNRMDTRRNR